MFSRSLSPIVPTHWSPAATQLSSSLQQALDDPYGSALLRDRLPLALFLFLQGILVVTIVRSFVLRRCIELYKKSEQDRVFNWPAITISFSHLFLPGLGALLFVVGFQLLQLDLHVWKRSLSLLPIGVIIFIAVLLTPLLALAWGVRWTTLVEIWWALNEGMKIGETLISLDIILLLVIVFVQGLGITRWLQKIFRVAILPRTKLDIGGQNALVTGLGYLGITLSALIAISSAGLDLSSLAILAGALSVGIGFGLQTIASNFVSGIILLVGRPIKEGAWIDVSGYSGYVRKISVRSTRIETFDRHDVIIPNADLVAGVVKNMTLTGMIGRGIVPVGIAYGSDVEEARRLLLEIADKHQMVLKYPEPTVLFMGLGESSLDFELRCFIRDVNYMLTIRSDLYFIIYKTLAEAGIEIPFPQRVVTLKKGDEPDENT